MSASTFSSPDQIQLVDNTEEIITSPLNTPDNELSDVYEISRVVDWVVEHGVTRVALQFPDNLLQDAPRVAGILDTRLGRETFILGDTTFGSCCVDEVAAAHLNADCVIHFGHTCLTPARSLPVLYVFTRRWCAVQELKQEIENKWGGADERVVMVYDVEYHHLLGHWDGGGVLVGKCDTGGEDDGVVVCGRKFPVDNITELSGTKVVFVSAGREEQTLLNLVLNFPSTCDFYVYEEGTLVPAGVAINKLVMRRYFLVEKVRDAERIGLLVGTLGTKNFDQIMDRLRNIIRLAGKKVYTFLVGKPNVPKLANFPEVDVFVLVSCPETTVIDSKEFLCPVVTPWELELGLTSGQEWTGELVTDFRELLPGGARYKGDPVVKDLENDISLITGKIRGSAIDKNISNGELQVINDKTVSVLHSGGGGQYLSERSWGGLVQDLGQTDVQSPSQVVQGRMGIASQYEGEPS